VNDSNGIRAGVVLVYGVLIGWLLSDWWRDERRRIVADAGWEAEKLAQMRCAPFVSSTGAGAVPPAATDAAPAEAT